MDHPQQFTNLSLCTGSGGLEEGIIRAGTNLSTVAYVEIEAFIAYRLVSQMEKGLLAPAPVWTDLKTFDGRPFRDRVHCITGGYPCQGESLAGDRKLQDDPRFLFNYISGIIQAVRPVCCFFENVGGHLSGSFIQVQKRLRSLGYHVEAGLYSAAETGHPHIRQRLFILAYTDLSDFRQLLANTLYGPTRISKKSKREDPALAVYDGTLELVYIDDSERTNFPETFNKEYFGSRVPSTNRPCVVATRPVAPPSALQYDYEAPRAVKCGVGCTVNGYNYRTDLLRMFGNAVVPDTAELAWRDLTYKILNSNT